MGIPLQPENQIHISMDAFDRLIERIHQLESMPEQATAAAASLRAFFHAEVGVGWGNMPDNWMLWSCVQFVGWVSGQDYVNSVFAE